MAIVGHIWLRVRLTSSLYKEPRARWKAAGGRESYTHMNTQTQTHTHRHRHTHRHTHTHTHTDTHRHTPL